MESQKAFRGALVNMSPTESPEATGVYRTWYMDIRRRNMAPTIHKIEESMLAVTMNLHDFNMMAGNLVVGGIAAAQLSKIWLPMGRVSPIRNSTNAQDIRPMEPRVALKKGIENWKYRLYRSRKKKRNLKMVVYVIAAPTPLIDVTNAHRSLDRACTSC